MNSILAYLEDHYQRLELDRIGLPKRMSAIMITPRFHASSHVLFLIFPKGETNPNLVVKIPRLIEASGGLRREIENLRLVQGIRTEGFDSIPRVHSVDEVEGRLLLIESALVGKPMDPAEVRRNPTLNCSRLINWLVEVQNASRISSEDQPDWYIKMVEDPLNYFLERFPVNPQEESLISQTREILAMLRTTNLPLVFEHGDLSHPNVLVLENNGVGVVDWEQAEPKGQPGADLFFFLTYVAFALHKSHDKGRFLPAIQSAFFTHEAWASKYILDYAERIELPFFALTPLFILCWFRYMTGILKRLSHAQSDTYKFGSDTAKWLRGNRYYTLWKYSVNHEKEITWGLN